MSFDIPRLDPTVVRQTLSSPPFVVVDGVINIRDIGGYLTQANTSLMVKSGIVFRSGELLHITELGKEQLRALGITTIFDLRADSEMQIYNIQETEIEGVKTVRVPIVVGNFDPDNAAAEFRKFEQDPIKVFVEDYCQILEDGAGAFEVIFHHLKAKPNEPCLFHCTAGKDRTGVFAAIFLLLLGVSHEDIAKDYALSTIGIDPAVPILFERLTKAIPSYKDHLKGLINMGLAKPEVMEVVLNIIREKLGGAEQYAKTHLHMTDDCILKLRQSFLVDAAQAVPTTCVI